MSLNPPYRLILCLPVVTRIGKWLWMMNLMLLLKIRCGSWCPIHLMLMWSGLCGFLLIKKSGVFERHKTRLVGDEKIQQVGVDCSETFSLIVKPTTIRTVLSLAVSKAGPFTNLTWRMLSCMKNSKRLCTCISPWVLGTRVILIMYAWWRNLYMASNRPLRLGTRDLLIMFLLLGFLIVLLIILSSFNDKVQLWLTFFCMRMILSWQLPLMLFASLSYPFLARNLVWRT